MSLTTDCAGLESARVPALFVFSAVRRSSAPLLDSCTMVRLRIDLGYDGFSFNGWAAQPGKRTVQGEVEAALERVLCGMRPDGAAQADGRTPLPHLVVAGRTDAGVHAAHQVCHLDVTEAQLARCVGHMRTEPVRALELRLQRMMPGDIAIHRVSVAPAGFDARFSALERTYVYRICDDPSAWDPRQQSYVWLTDQRLDESAMNEAAACTIGLHDFGSFAIANPGGTTIRDVKTAYWSRVPTRPLIADPRGERYRTPAMESGLLCFTIVADAFARNMVRSLVNGCVQVGLGKRTVGWFADKIATPLREGSTGPIAPEGLTHEHIEYPAEGELASRAEKIRARRTLPDQPAV